MAIFVNCPACAKKIEWNTNAVFRPFCSEKCKKIDLGAWAEEKYVIATPVESVDLQPDNASAMEE